MTELTLALVDKEGPEAVLPHSDNPIRRGAVLPVPHGSITYTAPRSSREGRTGRFLLWAHEQYEKNVSDGAKIAGLPGQVRVTLRSATMLRVTPRDAAWSCLA